jgi:hypothetical protein
LGDGRKSAVLGVISACKRRFPPQKAPGILRQEIAVFGWKSRPMAAGPLFRQLLIMATPEIKSEPKPFKMRRLFAQLKDRKKTVAFLIVLMII